MLAIPGMPRSPLSRLTFSTILNRSRLAISEGITLSMRQSDASMASMAACSSEKEAAFSAPVQTSNIATSLTSQEQARVCSSLSIPGSSSKDSASVSAYALLLNHLLGAHAILQQQRRQRCDYASLAQHHSSGEAYHTPC